MTAAADRGRELAVQALNNDIGKARLNTSIHHLEIGLPALRKAGLAKEAVAFEQAIWELTNLLHAWPPALRDQVFAEASYPPAHLEPGPRVAS